MQPAAAPDAEAPPAITLAGAARRVADWVIATGDNGARPFVIIDKLAADIFVFDVDGRLLGAAPALVGLAPGDDSAPGVGDRDLSAIQPEERTTPAGRFIASFGPARGHRRVLWVDYADAISLHPVVTGDAKERRLERLRSAAAEDHRISYGCINVPADFYADVVLKAFAGGSGVVYILPDTRSPEEVFPGLAVFAPASAAIKGAAGEPQAPPPAGADPHLADPGAGAAAAAEAPPPGLAPAAASDAPAVEAARGDPGR